MLSFTRRLPFFSKKLSMDMWQLYLFEVFFLPLFGLLALGYVPDFIALHSQTPMITVSAHDFAEFGMIGIYSVRISSFVAIARHNKQPQIVEWWIVIIGLSFTIFLFLFGGFLQTPYAAAYGYKYCFENDGGEVFVKQALPCPAPPAE